MSSFHRHLEETPSDIPDFGLLAAADPLTPWDSLQHLEKADKAVVDLLLHARNAVSPQTLQENEILGEMTITADLLLQHIRLFRERIDHFAGPNSASLSRQADMQLGDLAPGDIVPAPGPQWPDARNREIDMVIDQLKQSLSLMQAGHLKESMEAAADARQLTMALPAGFPILALHVKEMKGRYETRARKEERLGVVFDPGSGKTPDPFFFSLFFPSQETNAAINNTVEVMTFTLTNEDDRFMMPSRTQYAGTFDQLINLIEINLKNNNASSVNKIQIDAHSGSAGHVYIAHDLAIDPADVTAINNASKLPRTMVSITQDKLDKFKILSSYVSDGGTIVFVQCNSGEGEAGEALRKLLSDASGNRIKIVTWGSTVHWSWGSPTQPWSDYFRFQPGKKSSQ